MGILYFFDQFGFRECLFQPLDVGITCGFKGFDSFVMDIFEQEYLNLLLG